MTMPDLTVLYDGSCSLCCASVARLQRFNTRGRIELLDLHDPSVTRRFPQVDREAAMRLMQAVDPQGRVWSGSDAWARIGLLLPGWNAEQCADGTCSLHLPNAPSSKP
jgi:predicted DCC family thiol-disulfide oxidoreductase YuxK